MKKFVVAAPTWFPSSGGITILHKLVHTLNELGYDAYLSPSGPSGIAWHPPNAEFHSPEKYNKIKLLTQEVYDNLQDAIVVYPETWYGNYLNAPNVVRWIMGAADPQYMSAGSMYGISWPAWKESDLWFWYTDLYKTSTFSSFDKNKDNTLFLVEFHKDIFYNKNIEREFNIWTLRKSTGKVDPKDYIHKPEDIFLGDINKSLPNPDNDFPGRFHDFADLLNKTKTFYSYDAYTMVSFQAVMCGADSVVAPRPGLSKEEYYNGSELNRYSAYGLEDLDRARSFKNEINDHISHIESDSIKGIHTFVEKCYDYFK